MRRTLFLFLRAVVLPNKAGELTQEDYIVDNYNKIYCGDTDGDNPIITRYPMITQDPIRIIEKILGEKKYEKVGRIANIFSTTPITEIIVLDNDYDGISTHKREIYRIK